MQPPKHTFENELFFLILDYSELQGAFFYIEKQTIFIYKIHDLYLLELGVVEKAQISFS